MSKLNRYHFESIIFEQGNLCIEEKNSFLPPQKERAPCGKEVREPEHVPTGL